MLKKYFKLSLIVSVLTLIGFVSIATDKVLADDVNENETTKLTPSDIKEKFAKKGFKYSKKTGYLWPVKGDLYISSGQGTRNLAVAATNYHYGIDVVPLKSKSFYAMKAGKVIAVGSNDFSRNFWMAGNVIIIKQDDGKFEVYSEFKNGSQKVKLGQYVKQGKKLGTMGISGKTTGVHVHIGLTNRAWPGYGANGVSMATKKKKGWLMINKYLDFKRVHGQGVYSSAIVKNLLK
ncbi:murein DD-endopeptidase MepM/ murein hydrolase activator NlpD [Weissella beninensis]|uniref:M23 family metallopeptidase n=1 Tax=Periweissella beninensis TaxID=504936 RepID=A0ABT0VI98_9LACO|nr:M23 family metallopeptidase [Periweissella beninensis]MBM7544243.1 murein DD-endopeptidase MepM/ murein hydrolase activator NlpD [Periweissella beninensis]MCM2437550.1 M23 family metallopeptidase [Periweissella beninensis]